MGRKRILGKTTDYLTGREITDTDDERFLQKLARFLVEEKGYSKEEIKAKRRIEMTVEGRKVFSKADFVVTLRGKGFMVIRYGPGSLVTRERPALAAARILEPYPIPVTVVFNGEDAEIIDTATGQMTAAGIHSIPDRKAAGEMLQTLTFQELTPRQIEAEKRILSAYDYLEHSLECDDDWCPAE